MKICLVSPPTVTEFEDTRVADSDAVRQIAEHAPIGVLTLAAVLEGRGYSPDVVDLNQWHYEFLSSAEATAGGDFCDYVSDRLTGLDFDVLGLSTICSTYPLSIRIASAAKQRRPSAQIMLGGPQASVVDVATIEAFPDAVDFVVRGEAEESLPQLLDAIAGHVAMSNLQGVTYQAGGRVHRGPAAPVIQDLDQLPLPAFHLYPAIRHSSYVPLELGRGCPFACTFCSTNDFFRRRFRLKTPGRMIEQMRAVRDTYGVSSFDLIHDMFTVDRKRVAGFCEALLASGEEFYWGCSARTDCIDEDLIALMHRAGCRGIFFGIETGSARLQRIVEKDLDLEQARRMIACTDSHQIKTAVSLISGFPEENEADLSGTVSFFLDSLRFDHAEPHIHLLAPLVETPIFSRHRDELIFDVDVVSDMSHQGWQQGSADLSLIERYPDIFGNFYSVPTPGLDRHRLKELSDFLLYGSMRLRWLLVGLHQQFDFLEVFDAWRAWRLEHRPFPVDDRPEPYYTRENFDDGIDFAADFTHFLRTAGEAARFRTAATDVLVNYVGTLARLDARALAVPEPAGGVSLESAQDRSVPQVASGTTLVSMGADYAAVIRCLRRQGNLKRVRRRPVLLAARTSPSGQTMLIQLSELSANLLRLCDGRRTLRDVQHEFSHSTSDLSGAPPDAACLFGLELLRQQGLISVAPAPDGPGR